MKPSTWKNLLREVGRALALMLVVVSVLSAGVAHAHVDHAQAGAATTVAVASHHDGARAAASLANAAPSHCSTAAACHTLFFLNATSATFETESESAVILPLQYSAPPAPVFGLFRPPRRG